MNRTQRTALAAASAVICAVVATGCGALHDAPVSNAKANENTSAIADANSYSHVSQQADIQARQAARTEAEKKAVDSAKKAKADAESKAESTVETSDIPAWVTAINWAQTKLGTWYLWGGNCDTASGGRCDCSGLTKTAYAKAGVTLPRVANDQYNTTDVHPKRNELRPGDLVFFGKTERGIHHVGLYLGSGMMIHAPRTGRTIAFDKVSYMSDYYGATRVSP